MLHGHKAIGRKGKNVFFEINEKDMEEFEKLTMDYLTSKFSKFDVCLVSLKKILETSGAISANGQVVSDLGIAAYLLMQGYKVIGKKNKNVYFEVPPDQLKEFHFQQFDYLGGSFHQFDSYLMALKKVGEFLPDLNYLE